MYDELIKANNDLTTLLSEEKAKNNKLEIKLKALFEFARSFEYINPMHYEKLKEELNRIDGQKNEKQDTREKGTE
jgi:DNA-directed RNA polymerase subunit F